MRKNLFCKLFISLAIVVYTAANDQDVSESHPGSVRMMESEMVRCP